MAGFGTLAPSTWIDEDNDQVAAQAAAEAAAARGRRGYGSLRPPDAPAAPGLSWRDLSMKTGKLLGGVPAMVEHVAGLPAAMVDAQRRQAGAYGEITDSDPDPAKVGAEIATNLAGVGSMSFGSLAPKGSAGIFGGRLAKTADHEALARAEGMAEAGLPPNAIRSATGWFKGVDDKWRFEIPDNAAKLEPWVAGRLEQSDVGGYPFYGPAERMIEHPELYAAYPNIAKMDSFLEKGGGFPYRPGGRFEETEAGKRSMTINANDPAQARDVVLHELQHAVQREEGFARGGSPAEFTQQKDAELSRDALAFRRELDAMPKGMDAHAKENAVIKRYQEAGIMDWLPSREARDLAHARIDNPDHVLQNVVKFYGLDNSVTPLAGRTIYHRLAGEVEARNVQKRADWSPQQRADTPPNLSQDVDTAKQIVRGVDRPFGSLAPQASVPEKFDWKIAREAEGKLTGPAARALEGWVGGPIDAAATEYGGGLWSPGPLKRALADPVLSKEIETAFQPVRDALRREHGDTITLYRHHGEIPEGAKPHEILSFTSDRRVAEQMSGAPRKPSSEFSEAEIAAKEAELAKSGKVKIGRHTLEKNEYGSLDINASDGFVTDTPSVRDYLKQENEWARETNADRSKRLGNVKEYKVPVDDIIATTDRFNQREFIVRNSQKLFSNRPGVPFSMAPGGRDE